jgi:hypothetical protein
MSTEDRKLAIDLVIEPDGAATPRGVAAPQQGGASLEPWTDAGGRDYGYCYQEGDAYWVRIHGVGSFTFSRSSGQVRGAPEPGVSPDLFRDAFWREVVPFILQRHSWEVLHASGLVVAGVPVALCGNSEMGKSTLAHAWRRRGGRIYADDAIPFRVEDGSVSIDSIPFQVRLRPAARRYFEVSNVHPKEIRDGTDRPSACDRSGLQIIYLLERRRGEKDGPVRLETVCPAAALPALLHQAYCLTLRDRTRNCAMVATYMALVNRVPTFRLSYPTGLTYVEEILDRITVHVQTENPAMLSSPRVRIRDEAQR